MKRSEIVYKKFSVFSKFHGSKMLFDCYEVLWEFYFLNRFLKITQTPYFHESTWANIHQHTKVTKVLIRTLRLLWWHIHDKSRYVSIEKSIGLHGGLGNKRLCHKFPLLENRQAKCGFVPSTFYTQRYIQSTHRGRFFHLAYKCGYYYVYRVTSIYTSPWIERALV